MRRGHYLMAQIPDAKTAREGSFGFLVQTLGRRIDVLMKKELASAEIDVKFFANLMVLAEADGINQRALGEKLDFPEYYTSRNVDALVAAGYAERRPDPDSRRTQLVFLTDKGREKAAGLPKIIKRVNDEFLKDLDEDKKRAVIAILQEIAGIR